MFNQKIFQGAKRSLYISNIINDMIILRPWLFTIIIKLHSILVTKNNNWFLNDFILIITKINFQNGCIMKKLKLYNLRKK